MNFEPFRDFNYLQFEIRELSPNNIFLSNFLSIFFLFMETRIIAPLFPSKHIFKR